MSDAILGQHLPKLTLSTTSGRSIHIPAHLLGHWTVLYFYPKDMTSGCTTEACTYRDQLSEFQKLAVKVYGISMDSLDSHETFSTKHELNFPLISDPQHQLCEPLQVYDKSTQKLSRDTFIINPEGQVDRVWRQVDPKQSVQDVLDHLRSRLKDTD